MATKTTIERLFEYYLANQSDLVKKYNGKYLIITHNGVEGSFDKEPEAYYFAIEKYGLGNFLLQRCSKGDRDYTQHFYSPVVSFR